MTDGFQIHDGWLSEASVHALASWYSKNCPETDRLTFEAHLMVLRAYVALVEDSPLERVAGLSRARYNILRMIYQTPGRRLLMSEIVQGMNVSPTNVTKLVDGLAADGLALRAGDERDKRRTWVHLTEDGAGLVEAALPQVSRHVNSLWDGLEDEEKTVLIHLLAKMRMSWLSVEKRRPAAILRELNRRGVAASTS